MAYENIYRTQAAAAAARRQPNAGPNGQGLGHQQFLCEHAGKERAQRIRAGFAAAVSENTSIEEIQPAMTVLSEKVFVPEANEVKTYEKLYTLYDQLHDSFGVKGNPVDLFNVMKDLHIIRQESQNA